MAVYKVLVGQQRIKGGHTDWGPAGHRATFEEALELVKTDVHRAITSKGWKLDREARTGSRWYYKPNDPGQVLVTIKEQ